MFCRCENVWGEEPNTRTCPVCLAHPGTLPVPNRTAIEWTVKLGLALDCEIAARALFHRKNYFYPDLPKGYQISQYDVPLCAGGRFVVPGPDGDREIGIVRAHLEEDAAKTVHVGGAAGGSPAPSTPSSTSTAAARRSSRSSRSRTCARPRRRDASSSSCARPSSSSGISDAEMEKGSLRCDANVSVRRGRGRPGYRTKTELKNMNSFKFVADGIDGRGAPPDRDLRGRGRGRAGDAPLRSGERVDRVAPLEGGGARLPLLSRARSRSGRAAGRDDRVGHATRSASCLRRASAGSRRRSASTSRKGSWPAAATDSTSGCPATGAPSPNVVMNQLAATGVDPESVNGSELGKLIAERERIPRAAFTEALERSGDPGFSAERLPRARPRSPTRPSSIP